MFNQNFKKKKKRGQFYLKFAEKFEDVAVLTEQPYSGYGWILKQNWLILS